MSWSKNVASLQILSHYICLISQWSLCWSVLHTNQFLLNKRQQWVLLLLSEWDATVYHRVTLALYRAAINLWCCWVHKENRWSHGQLKKISHGSLTDKNLWIYLWQENTLWKNLWILQDLVNKCKLYDSPVKTPVNKISLSKKNCEKKMV